jgi:hypothetical protein
MAIATVSAATEVDPAWGNSVATAINAHEDAWTSHTITPSGFTIGSGTMTARYNVIGKTVFYRGEIVFAGDSTLPGNLGVDLPVNATTTAPAIGSIDMLDSGVGYAAGTCRITGSDSLEFHHAEGEGTASGRLTNTTPFTWAVNDIIGFSIVYEAA